MLYSRPDPGNAAELTLVGAALERLLADLRAGLVDRVRLRDGATQDDARDRPGRRAVRRAAARERRVPRTVPRRGRPRRRCARSATCPSAKRDSRPSCGPGSRARCATGRSRAPTQPPPLTAAGRVHPLLRGSDPGRRRPRARAAEGRGRARADAQRTRRPLLQDPRTGRTRIGQILGANITGLIDVDRHHPQRAS